MKKILLPIVTPFANGRFDAQSMHRLLDQVEPHVDVIISCLSSGEGGKLSGDAWSEVVRSVRSHTQRPVFAGMLAKHDAIDEYISRAAELGCEGVVLPLGDYSREELDRVIALCADRGLEVILYNTEHALVKDVGYIGDLASNAQVIGFKDSSMDAEFLDALIEVATDIPDFEIYQGMEMAISKEQNVDGYCIALANVEPAFCAQLPNVDAEKLQQFIADYDLESEQWYVRLKQILHERGIIQSSETIV